MRVKKGHVKLSLTFIKFLTDIFNIPDIFNENTGLYEPDIDRVQYEWYRLSSAMRDELLREGRLTFPTLLRMNIKTSMDGTKDRIRYESLFNLKEEYTTERLLKPELPDPKSNIELDNTNLNLLSLRQLQLLIYKNTKSLFKGRDYSRYLVNKRDEKEIPPTYQTAVRKRIRETTSKGDTDRFLALQSLRIGDLIKTRDLIFEKDRHAVIFDITATTIYVYLASDSRKIGRFRRYDGISGTSKSFFSDHFIIFDDEKLNLIPDTKNPKKIFNINT